MIKRFLGLTLVAFAAMIGCSGDPGDTEQPVVEEVDTVSEAVIDCNINCWQDAPGVGYLTATDFCSTPSPRVLCRWLAWPNYINWTTVIVPASCPHCENDTSHVCEGTCAQPDLASTWTCTAGAC